MLPIVHHAIRKDGRATRAHPTVPMSNRTSVLKKDTFLHAAFWLRLCCAMISDFLLEEANEIAAILSASYKHRKTTNNKTT